MIKAVIFDLGGTLIEYAGTYADWPELETPGMTAAHEMLIKMGVTVPEYEQFQAIGFKLLPTRWRQATLGEQNLTVDSLLEEMFETAELSLPSTDILYKAARQYEAAFCSGAVPLPDGRQTLAHLQEEGYRLGLISNTMFAGASHISDLERFGLADYFETMLFSGDANKWKPTTAPFLQVLEALGIDPEQAVYIGDDPASDVIGGRAAGMKTIYFPSSQRFPSPNGVQPDATISRLSDLPGCLVALNGA
ncbi:MAG: HAD family hydrolase [Candidatus Promineifilaceae bacterium]